MRPWVETFAAFALGFLGYTAAVSVATLQTAAHRMYPNGCTHADSANYAKLSAGCAFLWLLLIVSFVPRLFLLRVHAIVCAVGQSDALPFAAVEQDASEPPLGESMGSTLEMSSRMAPPMLV